MGPKRMVLLAGLSLLGLSGVTDVPGAPPGASRGSHVSTRPPAALPSHGGGQRHGWGTRSHGRHSHWGHGWGWGLGLAIGVPWALGWYDPWWGAPYYPRYAYGPAYRSYYDPYRYECGQDEECWRERFAKSEPAPPPTTEVVPATPGELGGPTQRPLHLNYCDAAKAWFPHVRTCPGGWRLVRPSYGP